MPKELYIGDKYSGINITWTPTANRIDIHGWYDSFVGIQGSSMSLEKFFKELGISRKHIKKAMENLPD